LWEHPGVLADALRSLSPALASGFEGLPLPVALRSASAGRNPLGHDPFEPVDLTDPDLRVALLVGPRALLDVDGVHRMARALGAPVANTWGAKGIYPWDSPHHMGTCGLQRDDFILLGLGGFDLVVTIGLDAAETRPTVPSATRFVAGGLRRMPLPETPPVLRPAGDNELFRRLSAIAQPGYVDESFPRHPARAVMDLKRSLGADTRVTAQPGEVGLWVARTFPTDRMGSVLVPAHDRPGVGAAVGLVSALQGTDTVTVVRGPVDEATATILDLSRTHDLPLRIEVWDDEVDWSRTEDLLAAAGPVVAWTA
jgi:hypothetical protein